MDGDPDWAALGDELRRAEEERDFSGIVRVSRGPEVLLESCHGVADRSCGARVHPGTRFPVASLSKMFTAVCVADAARRGELLLDAPVVEVLPAALRPSTLRSDVTVHHLLTHTSGIADYFEEDEDLPGHRDDYGALWADRPCYAVRGDRDLLPLFADLPPYGPPGEAWHYSNAGYVLLGLVVEAVTGRRFQDVVAERVFGPAGMAASGYRASDEAHPDVAWGYLPRSSPRDPWRTNVFSVPAVGGGDGGAVVTAADIDRFLRALASGEVWGEAVTRQVLAPHVPVARGWRQGYGVEIAPSGAWGKDGGDPGVEALSAYHPWDGTVVVALANVEGLLDPLVGPLLSALSASAGTSRSAGP